MRTKLYMIALAAISMMLGSCSDSSTIPTGEKSNNFADAINFARGGKFCD